MSGDTIVSYDESECGRLVRREQRITGSF